MRLEQGSAWKRTGDKQEPLLITDQIKNAHRIVALNEAATALGLTTGATLADARAQFPKIRVEEVDANADLNLLDMIADWADRYTPLVAIDPLFRSLNSNEIPPAIFKHGLFLDITGCSHLFQGKCEPNETPEAALVRDLKERLYKHGFHVQTGIAPNVGMAWALSRFMPETILESNTTLEIFSSLPLSALRLQSETTQAMERVGLKTIGQIVKTPRGPLASRFGRELMRRLDQLSGDIDESISPRLSPPSLIAERRFNEPAFQTEVIHSVIGSLAETLCLTLQNSGTGARLMEVSLFHTDGSVTRGTIATAHPLRDPSRIKRLFEDRLTESLERFQSRMGDAATGFDIIRLSVLEKDNLSEKQTSLQRDARQTIDAEIAHLIDKLSVRFGVESIYQLKANDAHLPELVERKTNTFNIKAHDLEQVSSGPPTRPLRLFKVPEYVETVAGIPEDPPITFKWRKGIHRIARAEGPERISTPWWEVQKKDSFTRDYYRVEDTQGRRFWLYRDGLYHHETVTPNWYLHGLFA